MTLGWVYLLQGRYRGGRVISTVSVYPGVGILVTGTITGRRVISTVSVYPRVCVLLKLSYSSWSLTCGSAGHIYSAGCGVVRRLGAWGWRRTTPSKNCDKKKRVTKMKAILSAETREQLNATLPQLFKLAVMMLNDYAAAVEQDIDGLEVVPPAAQTPAPTPAATPAPTLVEAPTERIRLRDRGKNATSAVPAPTPVTVLEPEVEEPLLWEQEYLEAPATPPKDRGKNAKN